MNKKVPIAVLSCFLIAFILQGVLKLCGVFVFEKVVNWDIFRIIEETKALKIIFCSLIVCFNMYCLSFAFTEKPYSNKWYHYVIIILCGTGITLIKFFIDPNIKIQVLTDIFVYIVVPFVINITNKKYRAFEELKFTNIVTTLIVHIILYFCYLGLTYWSSLLTSFIITKQIFIASSTMFLIYFEMYIGLVLLMFSLNNFIFILKENKKNDLAN